MRQEILKVNYEQAEKYWVEHDKATVKMPLVEIRKTADDFLSSHNTAALATGCKDLVRCTPIEYCWLNGYIYMLSEGGMKFHSLKDNKQVCLGIYEPYQGFGKLASIQITGTAEILCFGCEEYKKVLAFKKIPEAAIQKLNHPMYLIKVKPGKMELLFSSFTEKGYASRQQIEEFY